MVEKVFDKNNAVARDETSSNLTIGCFACNASNNHINFEITNIKNKDHWKEGDYYLIAKNGYLILHKGKPIFDGA